MQDEDEVVWEQVIKMKNNEDEGESEEDLKVTPQINDLVIKRLERKIEVTKEQGDYEIIVEQEKIVEVDYVRVIVNLRPQEVNEIINHRFV